MGLSVSVFTNISITTNEDYRFKAYVIDDSWNHKIKNLVNKGNYDGNETPVIKYPYSTHNRFREYLVSLFSVGGVLDQNGEIIWENLTDDMPFIDLILFADNEGCFDWETAGRLLKDFNKFTEVNDGNMNKKMMRYYELWHEGIKKATEEDGVIVFS